MRTIYCTSATPPHCADPICFGLVIFFISVAKSVAKVASDVGIQVETGLKLKALRPNLKLKVHVYIGPTSL
jgi:hypothetical protein